jgi:hypothetical protein
MKTNNRRQLPTRRSKKKPQSTNVAPPLSPNSRRIKKAQQRLAQDAAFKELLGLISANGGKKKYGDLQMIVAKYQDRGHFVERCHLEYCWDLYVKGQTMRGSILSPPIDAVLTTNETVVSDLSRSIDKSTKSNESSDTDTVAVISNDSELSYKRKGGRTKGTTIVAKNKKIVHSKKRLQKLLVFVHLQKKKQIM